MESRFFQDLLIQEELLEVKYCSPREDIRSRRKSYFCSRKNESILGFAERRERESLAMEGSSLKASMQMDSTPVHSCEETMEV